MIVTVRGKGCKIGTGSSTPVGEGESDDEPRSSRHELADQSSPPLDSAPLSPRS